MTGRAPSPPAVWFFLREYPRLYGALLLVTAGYALIEGLNIAAFFPLLQALIGGAAPSAHGTFARLFQIVRALPFADPLVGASVLVVGILIFKEALGFLQQVLVGYATVKVVTETKERVFARHLQSDYGLLLKSRQGDLVYSVVLAPGRLGNCLQYIPQLVTALLMTLSIGALLVSISWRFTLVLLLLGIGFNAATQFLARRVSYHIGTERATVSAEAQVVVNEAIDGARSIKVFDTIEWWRDRFRRPVRRFKDLVVRDTVWLAIPERLMQLVPVVVLLGLLAAWGYLRESAREPLGVSLAAAGVYALAFYRLVPYLTSFGRLKMQIAGTLPDVERLHELLTRPVTTIADGAKAIDEFRNRVTFERVSFSYDGGREALRDVSFSIPKEKVTAIVGPSGAGKSTVVALLTRLFDPTSGRILVDGIDLREIRSSSWRRLLGLVSQESFVFHGSVRDNVVFGRNGISPEKVREASRLAHAEEFISALPDTVVGDKGLTLSGGQRQRLAIARAIVGDPRILILDEATSSLDRPSELVVQRAIQSASRNRTVVVIAHRLSSVMDADQIIVLDQGRVVEQGTHDQLIARQGLYSQLYESQVVDELVGQSGKGP